MISDFFLLRLNIQQADLLAIKSRKKDPDSNFRMHSRATPEATRVITGDADSSHPGPKA